MSEDGGGPEDHRRHLGRGFNWLGGAAIIAKIVDFATILAVLLYLTKAQVGIGSLVIAFGMIIEAFDGLGTGDAVVQAADILRAQLDSLFWFIMGLAVVMGGLTLLAAPLVQHFYAQPGMALFFLAVAAKQPLVGAAVIPLALLNRALRYEAIATINVGATFGAAGVRFAIAFAGGGAWAIAGGYLASGVFILAGAMLAQPFMPRARFSRADIAPLLRFGTRSASANIFEQIFKNIDFILVGWFYGAAPLALYRVAFDIAMEPAMAIGTILNRAALPVFARAALVPGQLADALLWSLRRCAVLNAPLMVGLCLMAKPLMLLLHDAQGHSYQGAALPLQILALAAILRITAQLITPVLVGSGEPGKAAWMAAVVLLFLSTGICAVGFLLPERTGLAAVASVWFAAYPPLLMWGAWYLRRRWQITPAMLLQPFFAPAVAVIGLILLDVCIRLLLPPGWAAGQITVALGAMGMAYGGLFFYTRLAPIV